jgi:sensor domain DACNV-containing protein
MKEPAYPAARKVSQIVHGHLARLYAEVHPRIREHVAALPDAATIEEVIDAAFWTSLRRQEGYVPRVSLAFLSPQQTRNPLIFERPLIMSPEVLAKVAPVVERPGIHLGIWPDRSELRAWGMTRTIPSLCFVVEVAAPGLLVVKHNRGEGGRKFVNVAVLEGDQIKIVEEQASTLSDCPSLVTSLLGFESSSSWTTNTVNVLVQLAVSMRAHGRGGLLVVVPADSEDWRESIVQPVFYAALPSFSELANLARETADEPRQRLWQEELNHTVDEIAGLTTVDGATVLNSEYEVLGFGAKIARRKGSHQIEQVTITEPIVGNAAALLHPEQLGGTRHLAAAQFVHDQHESIALVASQDGRFTVFAWSPCEEMVHAHRVDVLLL